MAKHLKKYFTIDSKGDRKSLAIRLKPLCFTTFLEAVKKSKKIIVRFIKLKHKTCLVLGTEI